MCVARTTLPIDVKISIVYLKDVLSFLGHVRQRDSCVALSPHRTRHVICPIRRSFCRHRLATLEYVRDHVSTLEQNQARPIAEQRPTVANTHTAGLPCRYLSSSCRSCSLSRCNCICLFRWFNVEHRSCSPIDERERAIASSSVRIDAFLSSFVFNC
jgi:hypothetical protein